MISGRGGTLGADFHAEQTQGLGWGTPGRHLQLCVCPSTLCFSWNTIGMETRAPFEGAEPKDPGLFQGQSKSMKLG